MKGLLAGSLGPTVGFLALGALLPALGLDSYTLHLLSMVAIGAILALALQLLLGWSGQLSIGQAAFYGIGAYAFALVVQAGWGFATGLLSAGAAAMAASLLMVPITRLKGAYLAVATLGFTIIVYLALKNEEWLTGGAFGLMRIPRWEVLGFSFKSPAAAFYLNLGILAVVALAMARLHDSRFGRALLAMQQNDEAAQACGISLTRYKSQTFMIAALVSGIAGALYAHQAGYLNPNDFGFMKSMEILIMVVIGGVASLEGAILGALVVVLFPEYMRALDDYRMLLYGVVLVGMMFVGTGGLARLLRIATARLTFAVTNRRGGEATAAAALVAREASDAR